MTTQFQPRTNIQAKRDHSTGFSLAEVMVAMVIGLLTMIVIMQSYAAFEGQKRTTTSGSDTQENGLTAMHAIETDARMAGFGLITPSGLACTQMNFAFNAVSGVRAIAPVMIADGATSDTITFTYSTSPIGGNPAALATPAADFNADWTLYSANASGIAVDQDLLLFSTPGTTAPCSRVEFTGNINPLTNNMLLYNDDTVFPTGGYFADASFVLNMGSFAQNQYSINANDLVVQDVGPQASWTIANGNTPTSRIPLSSNIVNLQAQYGIAPTNTNVGITSPGVTCWTDAINQTTHADPNCNADWRPATITTANAVRIKAIRVAIVARSSLQEKPASSAVSAACDTTSAAPISWAGGPAIDLTANAKWQCHRYRVYQTIIPLRNMIWANL